MGDLNGPSGGVNRTIISPFSERRTHTLYGSVQGLLLLIY